MTAAVAALLPVLSSIPAQGGAQDLEQAKVLVRQARATTSIKQRIDLLKRASALVPAADIPHYLLGVELQCQGDSDAALAEFRVALDINPELWHAAYALGQLHVRAMQPEAGLPSLEQALAAARKRGASPEDLHRIDSALLAARDLCSTLPEPAAAASLATWADEHPDDLRRLRTEAAAASQDVAVEANTARQIASMQVLVAALLDARNRAGSHRQQRGRLLFLIAQHLIAMQDSGPATLGGLLAAPRTQVAGTRDATGAYAAAAMPRSALETDSTSDGAWLISAAPRQRAAANGPDGTWRVRQDGRDCGTVRMEVDGGAVRFFTADGRVLAGTLSGRRVRVIDSRTGGVGQFQTVADTTMELEFGADWQSATGTSVTVGRVVNSPVAVPPNRVSNTVRLERVRS